MSRRRRQQRGPLEDLPFYGKTMSPPQVAPYAVPDLSCRFCGSPLGGRFERTVQRSSGEVVDLYFCPCQGGHRREVRRER